PSRLRRCVLFAGCLASSPATASAARAANCATCCASPSAVESTLFLHAVARFGPLPKRQPPRPASAPRGFRVAHSRGQLFYKRANIRVRKAHIIDRVFALLDALQNPERAIASFLKRIRRGLRARRLVIAAPVAESIRSAITSSPHPALDTSWPRSTPLGPPASRRRAIGLPAT